MVLCSRDESLRGVTVVRVAIYCRIEELSAKHTTSALYTLGLAPNRLHMMAWESTYTKAESNHIVLDELLTFRNDVLLLH